MSMPPKDIFRSIPIGSLLIVPEEQRGLYVTNVFRLPANTRTMLFSSATGAYIRGLANTFNIPLESAPLIAFLVLRVAIGEIAMDQLAQTLASELSIDPQTAQAMAQDIEKELFAPIALEWNQYLSQKQQGSAPTAPSAPQAPSIPNLLDLKNLPKQP